MGWLNKLMDGLVRVIREVSQITPMGSTLIALLIALILACKV